MTCTKWAEGCKNVTRKPLNRKEIFMQERDYIKIGERIYYRRKKDLKLTQSQLAKRMAVSPKTISNWECGTKHISLEHLVILSNSLGVTPNDLLGYSA